MFCKNCVNEPHMIRAFCSFTACFKSPKIRDCVIGHGHSHCISQGSVNQCGVMTQWHVCLRLGLGMTREAKGTTNNSFCPPFGWHVVWQKPRRIFHGFQLVSVTGLTADLALGSINIANNEKMLDKVQHIFVLWVLLTMMMTMMMMIMIMIMMPCSRVSCTTKSLATAV